MVHLEWIMAVVRGKSGQYEPWTPYEFSCTLICRGDEAEAVALSGKIDRDSIYDLVAQLKNFGIKSLTFDRKRKAGFQGKKYVFSELKIFNR